MSCDATLLFSDPDISLSELERVETVLKSPRLTSGPMVEALESAFEKYLGRQHAIAVHSATLGLLLALKAKGIGPGDEVILSSFGFRETVHAVALSGAIPIFVEIDYWSCTLVPEKVEAAISPRTKAIVAQNTNGHPALWGPLRSLADFNGLFLLEDSSEAVGSRYQGHLVGTFGDCSIFDLTQPGPISAGEGGVVVTDDAKLAQKIRDLRTTRLEDRHSVVATNVPSYRAELSDINAALALTQLERLDEILARRKQVAAYYDGHMLSFEGIKPAYIGPEVDEIHWMTYLVHLGTRFTRSSRDAILNDLATEQIEAHAYCYPFHTRSYYTELGYRRGQFFVTEKLGDRAIALPYHGHLTEDQVGFIVKTTKDASINVGAGAAIYL